MQLWVTRRGQPRHGGAGVAFEKEFDIDIPDEEAEKLRTGGTGVADLHEKMGKISAWTRRVVITGLGFVTPPLARTCQGTWEGPERGRSVPGRSRGYPGAESREVALRSEGLEPGGSSTRRRSAATTCSRKFGESARRSRR